MNSISCLVWAVVFYGSGCCAQTNSCPAPCTRYWLPPVQLRALPRPEPEKAPSSILAVSPPAGDAPNLEAALTANGLHTSWVRNDTFYLTRPAAGSESGLVRFVDGVFAPEVIRVGKTSVSCTIITAVKRKNPLCLLNPIFFQASW